LGHIQTFPIDAEIRSLGIDFGLVVLMVKNNWGMDKYTCLYRVRVHGQRMDTP
jgi:SUN domain-containing protein 1/2